LRGSAEALLRRFRTRLCFRREHTLPFQHASRRRADVRPRRVVRFASQSRCPAASRRRYVSNVPAA
jgi:hypothetical protein